MEKPILKKAARSVLPLLFFLVLFISFFYFNDFLKLLLASLSFLLFLFFMTSPDRIFLAVAVFLSVFPLEYYRKKVYGIPFGINDYHIAASLAFFVLFSVIFIVLNYNKIKTKRVSIPLTSILVIPLIAFYMFLGFIKGHEIIKILRETMILLMYVLPFLFLSMFNINKEWVFRCILSSAVAVSIQYFIMYSVAFSSGHYTRMITQMATITIIAFPIIIFKLISRGLTKFSKMMYVILLFFTVSAALLSMQRSLWVCILADIVICISLMFYNSEKKFSFTLKIILSVAVLVILIFVSMHVFKAFLGEDIFNLLSFRFSQFKFNIIGSDRALNVRMDDFSKVNGIIDRSNFLGVGLGAVIMQSDTGKTKEIIDNSYLFLLWKTGFIGLLIVVGIYLQGLFTLLKSVKSELKKDHYGLILAVILFNFLLNGIVDTTVVMYRHVIWIGIVLLLINQDFGGNSSENSPYKHSS